VLSGVILCVGLNHAARHRQPPREPRWDNQEAWSYVPFFLAPIAEPDEPLPPVEEVWSTLFEGMAADPETHALLRRLCVGTDMKLTARESHGPDEEKVTRERQLDPPPIDQRSGFLELRTALPGQRGVDRYAACLNVRVCCSLYLYMDGHFLRRDNRSTALDLMRLLANDYLLRHRRGYQLVHGEVMFVRGGPTWDAVPEIEGSPDLLRRRLDMEISDFVNFVQDKLNEQ
jgi:hypothetical protein